MFKGRHEKILEQLAVEPKLHLRYLDQYLNTKEEQMQIVWQQSALITTKANIKAKEEKKGYERHLICYFKLLCDLEPK
jgi:hypothetical protein